MSKWIEFKEALSDSKKTKTFNIYAKQGNLLLGQIKWFGRWRKYAFFPAFQTVFETDCLNDITEFLKQLMNERKKESSG